TPPASTPIASRPGNLARCRIGSPRGAGARATGGGMKAGDPKRASSAPRRSSSPPCPRQVETAALSRRPITMPPGPAIVEGVAQPEASRVRPTGGRCVPGAGADTELIIHDEAVSRRHAELTLVPEGVAVRDLGRRNGTFYAGQRIEKMVVALGSRIHLGPVDVAIT